MILMHMASSSLNMSPYRTICHMDPIQMKFHDFQKKILALDQVQALPPTGGYVCGTVSI